MRPVWPTVNNAVVVLPISKKFHTLTVLLLLPLKMVKCKCVVLPTAPAVMLSMSAWKEKSKTRCHALSCSIFNVHINENDPPNCLWNPSSSTKLTGCPHRDALPAIRSSGFTRLKCFSCSLPPFPFNLCVPLLFVPVSNNLVDCCSPGGTSASESNRDRCGGFTASGRTTLIVMAESHAQTWRIRISWCMRLLSAHTSPNRNL
mmetsp:Transcript_78081/g.203448  ORF Transcript_78081/g.203448 Transcript_78081/m.203448 type:complete len:203 (+) Transcript_78081:275-883(+)